jgi:hypothetical protein
VREKKPAHTRPVIVEACAHQLGFDLHPDSAAVAAVLPSPAHLNQTSSLLEIHKRVDRAPTAPKTSKSARQVQATLSVCGSLACRHRHGAAVERSLLPRNTIRRYWPTLTVTTQLRMHERSQTEPKLQPLGTRGLSLPRARHMGRHGAAAAACIVLWASLDQDPDGRLGKSARINASEHEIPAMGQTAGWEWRRSLKISYQLRIHLREPSLVQAHLSGMR